MAKEAKSKEKKIKDNNKKNKKEKKSFFKGVKAELKKVIWPTPKQLINNTIAVIVYTLVVGVIVVVLDICFEKINTLGIDKIKASIQSSEENAEITNNEMTDENSVPAETNSIEDTNIVE